jgi:serine/threonine protein phosphatase PrpC
MFQNPISSKLLSTAFHLSFNSRFLFRFQQDPDLTEQRLEDRDFVVMASDGLWDVLSNQEVVHMVAMEAAKTGWSGVSCFCFLCACFFV